MSPSIPRTIPIAVPDWAEPNIVYIGWPTRPDVWRNHAKPARSAIAVLARAIATFADVCIVSSLDLDAYNEAKRTFSSDTRIQVSPLPMDDCWLRDIGPIFAVQPYRTPIKSESDSSTSLPLSLSPATSALASSLVGVSFEFNAWGGAASGCYSDFARDRKFGATLCAQSGVLCVRRPMVLEGGAVCVDGRGTVLTTAECLLRGNRNANATTTSVELELTCALGARRVLWLPYGAARDADTDGHVDNMCVFVAPHIVLLHWAEKCDDVEQWRRSTAALEVLHAAVDTDGHRLRVVKVRAPRVPLKRTLEEASGVEVNAGNGVAGEWTKPRVNGEPLCASYVNVLMVGKRAIIVPAFGESEEDDRNAVDVIQGAVGRERVVISVPAREFVLGGGGIHCLTLASPKVTCQR